MNATQAVEEIQALDEVFYARLWDAVPGKERIYISTRKHNGGRSWNGGLGYRECYVDLATKRVVANGEASAATRKALAGTLVRLAEIAQQIEA